MIGLVTRGDGQGGKAMQMENRALVLDLVEWVAKQSRPYGEVMEAWRTSCPRLTIWEDALDHGLIVQQRRVDGGIWVVATDRGRSLLRAEGRNGADYTHGPR